MNPIHEIMDLADEYRWAVAGSVDVRRKLLRSAVQAALKPEQLVACPSCGNTQAECATCANVFVVHDDTALLRQCLQELEHLRVVVDEECGAGRDIVEIEIAGDLWPVITDLRERLK